MERVTFSAIEQLYKDGKQLFDEYYIVGCFPGATLSNARFTNCVFHEGDLSRTDLSSARLENVRFEYLSMQEINLSSASLGRCSFVGDINLAGAQCKRAWLKEIVLQHANLERVDFTLANLEHAQLQQSHCQGARFHQAQLSSANFRQADIRSAVFTRARVAGTNFEETIRNEETSFRGAVNKRSMVVDPAFKSELAARQQLEEAEDHVVLFGKTLSLTVKRAKERVQEEVYGRPKQQQFHKLLMEAYANTCAISGCSQALLLDAAHIVPHCLDGEPEVQNGILLRTDLHRLFDRNLLTIDPATGLVTLDASLQMDSDYQAFHGHIVLPPYHFRAFKSPGIEQVWRSRLRWREEEYADYL